MKRRPSWIARRRASVPPAAPAPQVVEPVETKAEAEPPAVPPSPPTAPPPRVDLAASLAMAQLADENAALQGSPGRDGREMARLRREVLEASEPELVRLALAIAERVVGAS